MRLNSIFLIVLLSLLLPIGGAFAQEGENVELVGQILYPDLSESYAIQISDDFVYFIEEAGLKIFDMSEYPVVVGYLDIEGDEALGGGVEVVGDLAYVGAGTKGFYVIDVSDPSAPEHVGFLEIDGRAIGVSILNQYAYVAAGNSVFYVIDISNPEAPQIAGSFDIEGGVTSNSIIRNDLALVASGPAGLQILNISDPSDIQLIGSFGNNAIDLRLRGDFAYLAADAEGFIVLDVSDPEDPVLVGSMETSGAVQGVEIIGNYAYTTEIPIWIDDNFEGGGLRVISISDPERPNQTAYYRNPDLEEGDAQSIRDIVVNDNRAFIVDHVEFDFNDEVTNALGVINVTNPRNPQEIASYKGGEPNDVILSENIAYISGYGLDVIDITQVDNPQSIGYLNNGNTHHRIELTGDFLYSIDSGNNLSVIDVSDPSNPTETGIIEVPGIILDLDVIGNHAFIANETDGIRIINVSDPSNPEEVTLFNTPGEASDVIVLDNIAYIADGSAGLLIADFTNPAEPVVLGSIETPANANALFILNGLAFIATDEEGLSVIDVTDQENPIIIGTSDTPGNAVDVFVEGDYAQIADLQGGLRTVIVDYPDDPEEDGYYISPDEPAYRVFALDELIAVVGNNEVGLYDFVPPEEFSNIVIEPDELGFGEVFVSDESSLTFSIVNDGRADLVINDITVAGDVGFSTDFEAEFSLIRNSGHNVTVFFAPEVAGNLAGTVTIHSNDPEDPEVTVDLVGTGFTLPSIQIDPIEIDAVDRGVHPLSVINNGNGPLDWTSEIANVSGPNFGAPELDESGRWMRNIGNDRAVSFPGGDVQRAIKHGHATLAQILNWESYVAYIQDDADHPRRDEMGVRDEGGYQWIDNAEEGGLEFEWIDITDIGIQLEAEDDWNSGAVDIGFEIQWYDQVYSDVYICSNGWVSFSSDNNNFNLPRPVNQEEPNAVLLINQYDLDPSGEGEVYFWTNNEDIAVVSWLAVQKWREANVLTTFQVVLNSNGTVVYQYGPQVNSDGSSSNIGYESPNGNFGASILYRQVEAVYDGLAIEITSLPADTWVIWEPVEGHVEAGESEEVSVRLFSDLFVPGDYSADLHILSNDRDNPDVLVDIYMQVVGNPAITLDAEVIDFGEVLLFEEGTENLTIGNRSNGDLVIENIFIDGDQSYEVVFDAEIIVPWGDETIIPIAFHPEERALIQSEIVIISNDPENPEVRANLTGTGLAWPTIVVNPMEFNVTGTSDNTLVIENQGDSDLEWSVNIATVPDPRRDNNQRSIRSIGPERHLQFDHRSDPDDMGYEWRDNRENDGPEFNWFSIDDFEGVQLFELDDNENTGVLQLGFSYPFWNREFSEVYCHSDAWMSFSDGGDHSQPDAWGDFPYEGQTENCIMVHNADYHQGTNLWFWTNEIDKAIVWWAGDFDQNSQLILYGSGLAVMQYGAGVTGQMPWWRIGANLGDGVHGWSISLGERWFLREGLSIAFGPSDVWNNWLTLDQYDGVIASDAEQELTLSIDRSELLHGDYSASLYLNSNDPDNREIIVDVNLTIESFEAGVSEIEVDGGIETLINIFNNTPGDLNWSSSVEVISIPEQDDPGDWLFWEPLEGLIESDSFQEIVVSLSGDDVISGDYEANLVFTAEDEDIPDVSVSILLHVYDTEIEPLGMLDTPGDSWEAVVRSNYAFICDYASGLHIVDISDKNNPVQVGTHDTPGYATRAFILGDFAYVADRGEGLRIINIRNVREPSEVGFYETPGIAYDVEISRGYAYVTDREGGLLVLDVSDPTSPELLSSTGGFEGYAYGIKVVDDIAYVGDRRGGIYTFNVVDPANPELLGVFDTPGQSYDLFIEGGYAYVADGASGLRIVDVSDPSNPLSVGSFNTLGSAHSIDVVEGHAFIADVVGGLRVVNIEDPTNPYWVDAYRDHVEVWGITVDRGYAHIAGAAEGYGILDVSVYTGGHNNPPIITVDPLEINSHDGGEYTIGITNDGDRDLSWESELTILLEPQVDGAARNVQSVIVAPSRDRRGDSDAFNYYWIDNTENFGPDYEWIDIAENGMILPAEDDWNSAELALGFAMPWYGQEYRSITVNSNGFVVLGDLDQLPVDLPRPPNPGAPNGALLVNNLDLNPSAGGRLLYWTDGEEIAVVSWIDVPTSENNDYLMTFQVILYASGEVLYQYGPMPEIGGLWSNIGFESNNGLNGSSIIYHNPEQLYDGLAIRITDVEIGINDWITWEPVEGTIEPHETTETVVILNPAGWVDGDYAADLHILSNDNDNPEVIVSIHMHVGEFIGGHTVTYYTYLGTYILGQGAGEMIPVSGEGEVVEEGDAFILSDYNLEGLNFGESMESYLAGFSGTNFLVELGSLDENIEIHILLNNLIVEGGGDTPLELTGIYSPDPDMNDNLWMFADLQVWSDGPDSTQLNVEEDFVFIRGGNMVIDLPLDAEFDVMKRILGLEYNALAVALWDTDLGLWDNENITGETVDIDGDDHLVITLDHLSIIAGGPADGFNNFEEFTIQLPENWSLISSPVAPMDTDMLNIWADIVERGNLLMVKDQDGRFYSPEFGFNNLQPWGIHFGYQSRLAQAEELNMTGIPVRVETAIPLRTGWSIVAYYPDVDLDVIDAFAGVGDALEMVKNSSGRFYSPAFRFSNMEAMTQGEGYKVKVSEETELIWNIPDEQLAAKSIQRSLEPVHYSSPIPTDNDMSVLILGEKTNSGLEVAAYSIEGQVVGVGVFDESGRAGLSIWGDDPTTDVKDGLTEGEEFELRVWDAKNNVELDLKAGRVLTGSLSYSIDGFTVLGDIEFSASVPNEYYMAQNYPNPFNSITQIAFGLPEASNVSVKVYDLTGRMVMNLIEGNMEAGHHVAVWDASASPTGVYLVKMTGNGFRSVKKVTLLK